MAMNKISVLMPVYNGATYLHEAVSSILAQNFANFEFLIIDDGSTDQSVAIIQSYSDQRIHLVRNEVHRGFIFSLNLGLELIQAEYMARMDCDDISLPERLQKQVAILDRHPEIGVCGTWFEYFMGRSLIMRFPEKDADIKREFTLHNCIGHPTVMLRTEILKKHHLKYGSEFIHTEDYDLWAKLAPLTCFYNVPEVLYKYRIHEAQISQIHVEQQLLHNQLIQERFRQMQSQGSKGACCG
jgi:glycosyltransferase involved in cell wall biosynthesis